MRVVLGLLLFCVLTGCGGRSGGWVLSRLYFGLSSPQGPVAEEQFAAFLDQEITPRFPDGLTRYRAEGQWRGADGAVLRESSVVVEIAHPESAANAAALAAIIAAYKQRFHQEAVMLVQDHQQVRFE